MLSVHIVEVVSCCGNFAHGMLCHVCRLRMEVCLKVLEQCLATAQATALQLLLRQECPLMASQLPMFSQGRNETWAMTRSAAFFA